MPIIRLARPADLPLLHPVIERAYRGDTARQGWTFESDLLDGQRTDIAALSAILASPVDRLLVAERDGALIGCVQVTDKGAPEHGDGGTHSAYLGLLCVDPSLQAAGLGRALLAAAEALAVQAFGAERIEMTVIDQRAELIAYYEQRGYVRTGESRPFPLDVTPPLRMAVLARPLPRPHAATP
ncbi:GNAT family N-acetyltransferase [Sphingobium sp. H39-3-25]|uniref:GNAT family N-acetyltransferase n=1 Tax=Sphingobium arseniciresistens TaxID=3030834 RepID=UPI0023B886FE|nr:GNAT family N-acetyltransferase [Sphingobium arseniciresistens]